MDEMAAEKTELREDLLAARRARSAAELATARSAVRGHVMAHAAAVTCVAGYLPLRTEPGSLELLAALADGGAEVIVPITLPDRSLDWAHWSRAGLGDPLGVAAIGAAGLVLAPALAVDRAGTRLGRGGGSYDRALAQCRPDAVLAALVFADEILPWLPREPWDVPVGAAVTPGGWVELGEADAPDGNADF